MGYVIIQTNAIRACECRWDLSACHGHCLSWTHGTKRSGVPRWCDYVFKEMGRPHMPSKEKNWAMPEIRDSMNPKKIIFLMSEGNLPGHIVSKRRIKVDLDWVQTITQIPQPANKKEIQSFLGKINFLRKFILDYEQIVKPMQAMIKKDAVYSWGKRENYVFTHIK